MNDLLHVLVIGAGSIGERHARCFLATRRARVSIVEPAASVRSTVAERYAIEKAHASLDDALKDSTVQAAVICTPAQMHIAMAMRLADRGIHLLIEKPLSTTFDDIEALERRLAEKKLVGAVAYVMRTFPAIRALRDAIKDGRFGRPLEVVVSTGQNFPHFRPAYLNTYYTNHATGGGAIQDALTHSINAVEWMVGPTRRVIADAAHLLLPGVTVEDTVHVLTRHGEGGRILGSVCLNQHQAPTEMVFTVVCERGTLRFENHNVRWGWMADINSTWNWHPLPAPERDQGFIDQASAFLDSIEHHVPPLCTIAEGAQTLKVNLAALESVRASAWRDIH